MINDPISPAGISVDDFLKSNQKAVRFFLDWHTACVGCGFARFCTLQMVVETYQLDEKKFLSEAEKWIDQNQTGES